MTGGPRDGYPAQAIEVDLGADLATGGRPDTNPAEPGLQGQAPESFYRDIADFPDGQGSSTEPMSPPNEGGH